MKKLRLDFEDITVQHIDIAASNGYSALDITIFRTISVIFDNTCDDHLYLGQAWANFRLLIYDRKKAK